MRRMLLVAFLLLTVLVCVTSPAWTDGLDDLDAGSIAFNERDYDKAISLFTKAIMSGELTREDLRFAYEGRGQAWAEKGDNDRAIADYTKAIVIDPKDAGAYYSRGNAWYNKSDYDKAIADYTKTIEINPKVVEVYILRGASWDAKGDYDKAIADFTKAIEINPKAVEAYNGLAWLLATCRNDRYRDGKRAIALAEKAVKLEETANRLDTLAAAYAEAGRFQEAVKTEERAITRIKQSEGWVETLPEYEKHLSSYKAGKPWREK